jgi:DNA-binding phage protein
MTPARYDLRVEAIRHPRGLRIVARDRQTRSEHLAMVSTEEGLMSEEALRDFLRALASGEEPTVKALQAVRRALRGLGPT